MYIDGFVLPVLKRNIKKYVQLSRKAGKVWKDHGALEYKEWVGDDLNHQGLWPFSKTVRLKKGEAVLFSYIVYKSRAHRDKVNAKVMKDPRVLSMDPKSMPFDSRRMAFGGFKPLVML